MHIFCSKFELSIDQRIVWPNLPPPPSKQAMSISATFPTPSVGLLAGLSGHMYCMGRRPASAGFPFNTPPHHQKGWGIGPTPPDRSGGTRNKGLKKINAFLKKNIPAFGHPREGWRVRTRSTQTFPWVTDRGLGVVCGADGGAGRDEQTHSPGGGGGGRQAKEW